MPDDLEAAWNEIHEAKPEHWFVGHPMELHPGEWVMYAYDPMTRRRRQKATREWTAVASSEAAAVAEMARCLQIIRDGGWPD